MEYEIWSSESGNRLAAFPIPSEALAWLFDLWTREGDAGLEGLSLGDQDDHWVLSGDPLKKALQQFLWNNQPVVTSSNSTTQDLRAVPPAFLGGAVSMSLRSAGAA